MDPQAKPSTVWDVCSQNPSMTSANSDSGSLGQEARVLGLHPVIYMMSLSFSRSNRPGNALTVSSRRVILFGNPHKWTILVKLNVLNLTKMGGGGTYIYIDICCKQDPNKPTQLHSPTLHLKLLMLAFEKQETRTKDSLPNNNNNALFAQIDPQNYQPLRTVQHRHWVWRSGSSFNQEDACGGHSIKGVREWETNEAYKKKWTDGKDTHHRRSILDRF